MSKTKAQKRELTITQKFLKRLRELNFPEPTLQIRFDKDRRWTFDLAWIHKNYPKYPYGAMVALEIQGRGRHQTAKGTREDYIKFNEAQTQGWIVIFATSDMLNNDEVIIQLFDALKLRGGIL
jgi:hypothetical protein